MLSFNYTLPALPPGCSPTSATVIVNNNGVNIYTSTSANLTDMLVTPILGITGSHAVITIDETIITGVVTLNWSINTSCGTLLTKSVSRDLSACTGGAAPFTCGDVVNCETPFSGTNSSTITWTGGGVNGHSPTASVNISNLISTDANNIIALGTDNKLYAATTVVFDDQILSGTNTDTANITLTPTPPSGVDNQVDYTLEVNVKTQCEIDSDVNGIKLVDSFYDSIDIADVTGDITATDITLPVREIFTVKDGCKLRAFVNEPVGLLEFTGGDISTLTDLQNAKFVEISIDSTLPSDIDMNTWFLNCINTFEGQEITIHCNEDLYIINPFGIFYTRNTLLHTDTYKIDQQGQFFSFTVVNKAGVLQLKLN